MKRGTQLLLTLTFLIPLAAPTFGSVIVYDDEITFLKVAPITSTETFDEFPHLKEFFTPTVTIDAVTYDVKGPCFSEGSPAACWVAGIDLGGGPVTPPNDFGSPFAFGSEATTEIGDERISFGGYVTAFGFWFLSGAILPPPHWQIVIQEVDGRITTQGVFSDHEYFGFVSNVGIVNLIVHNFPGDLGKNNWSYDNVSRADIMATPEPGTLSLLTTALVAGGIRYLRRRHA